MKKVKKNEQLWFLSKLINVKLEEIFNDEVKKRAEACLKEFGKAFNIDIKNIEILETRVFAAVIENKKRRVS